LRRITFESASRIASVSIQSGGALHKTSSTLLTNETQESGRRANVLVFAGTWVSYLPRGACSVSDSLVDCQW
jgi:hypothetical protein